LRLAQTLNLSLQAKLDTEMEKAKREQAEAQVVELQKALAAQVQLPFLHL
jgi:hypothetical protein